MYLVVLLSFFLDGLLSIYQELSIFGVIYFKPMFTIVSLVLIYPKYQKDINNYLKICLVLGLCYDLFYTNMLFLNMLVFPLLGYIIHRVYLFLIDGLVNSLAINLIALVSYNFIIYFVLFLTRYLSFNVSLFLYDLLSILITNTIYFIILYLLLMTDKNNFPKKKKYKF